MTAPGSRHIHFSAADSPIALPPVDDAWEDMRRKLDESKRRGGFWIWWRGMGGGGRSFIILAILCLLFLGMLPMFWRGETHYRSGMDGPAKGVSAYDPQVKQFDKQDKSLARLNQKNDVQQGVNQGLNQGLNQGVNKDARQDVQREVQQDVQRPTNLHGKTNLKKLRSVRVEGPLADLATGDIEVRAEVRGKPISSPRQTKKQTPDKHQKPQDSTRILYAAGLQDGKSFPFGGQQPFDYNANLKKDLWADYIPTPYFEYHPSARIAIRTGIQLNNPQYTDAVTIFHKAGDTTLGGSVTMDTNIVVKKLYYFNIPLSIDYSPIKNLYLGAGIQYSGLNNGIAFQNNVIHQINGGHDTVQNFKVISLKKNQPAYGNLKRTDWRLLFETNYYWKRFTLALQYRQGLTNYVRQPVDGSQGSDRNKDFNIELRYNIWEKRVKTAVRN